MDSIGDFIAFVGAGLVKAGEGLQEMIGVGLQTAPALVLGLSVIVALPVLILAGMVLRRVTPVGEGTSRYFGPLPEEIKDERGDDEGPSEAYSEAFIFVESDGGNGTGTGGFQFTDGSMMVRIGREEDNEIRLTHPTVHRYHALIRRSIEDGYEIADLSDVSGNGVLINGEKISHRRLFDGDVISLGAARLRFAVDG
ncbi:MAG: FHA domain-containing protein [Filomicrobium sp.]